LVFFWSSLCCRLPFYFAGFESPLPVGCRLTCEQRMEAIQNLLNQAVQAQDANAALQAAQQALAAMQAHAATIDEVRQV
jgi:hypothetical protein